MAKKKTNSRLVIRDDILNDNHRVGHGRSRREDRDRTTTQRTVDRAEKGPTGQEQTPKSDGPSGTHCTVPSVNAETVIAARRPTGSQGRPLGGRSIDKEAPKQPFTLCSFYMRTGTCGYGDNCRYIHPPNVRPPTLSPLGYPLREGVQRCRFYMRNGFCGFGATCEFDHPTPPSEQTGQRLPPTLFVPTMNPGAPFSEPMYVPQMTASSWYGPVPPPLNYAAYMSSQHSFPFARGYLQYPFDYPPLPMPLTEGWPQSRYLFGSPPFGFAGPTTSEETSELYEDVSKFDFEDDSDTSGQIDRCWSN